MRIKSLHMAIIVMLVLFGGVAASSVMGYWSTKNEKVPATYESGEFKGQYDPSDIRGSYTFQEISDSFRIPLEDLGKAFGIKDSKDFADYQCKNLEATYAALKETGKEIGTGSVRYFVALYNGLPIEVEEDTYLLKPALSILKEKAAVKLTAEQIAAIEHHSVGVGEAATEQTETAAVAAVAGKDENVDKTVKGSTTFKDLLDWGVKQSEIETVVKGKFKDPGEVIKDYASSNGMEFGTMKPELQKLVDSAK